MVKICIKENKLDKTLMLQNWATEEIALKMGYKIVILEDKYIDCIYEDFNNDYSFNIDRYTMRKQKESINNRIAELKSLLCATDYQAIKYAENEISIEDYLPIKNKRASYRAEINSLEEKLKNLA